MSTPNPMTLSPEGSPFKDKKAAQDFAKAQELDQKIHIAIPESGGWALFDTTGLDPQVVKIIKATADGRKNPAGGPKGPKHKYFKVTFQARTNQNDEEDVTLTLNGKSIILKRNKLVILSDSYIEVAAHAERSQYEIKPDLTRKFVGMVSKYMWRTEEEATKEQYEEFLRTGNALRDKDLLAQEQAKS